MIVYLRKNNFCKFSIFFLVSVKLICEFCFMNTSSFGPCGWQFMFFVAAGYDMNETPKIEKDKQYKHFFKSIGDCLPCKYCRQSYGIFYEKLKIEEYMKMPSCGLIKFVYDLKQLVNQKLWVQETKALQNEFNNLKSSDLYFAFHNFTSSIARLLSETDVPITIIRLQFCFKA